MLYFHLTLRKLLPLALIAPCAVAQTRLPRPEPKQKPPGITVAVNADGSYSLEASRLAWTFGGNVGAAVTHIFSSLGSDGIGPYQKTSFQYSVNGNPRSAGIRTYLGQSIVVFSTTLLAAGTNTALFPQIASYPQGLNKFGFNFTYGYQYGPWGEGVDSPWAYFDANGNTFVVSPAAHFPLAYTTQDQAGGIVAGINPSITNLPSGFTYETMLVTGTGVNHTWDVWGRAMTDLQGKVRPGPQSDPSLIALGYWTDSASKYYYNYVQNMGYEGTLRAVKDDFARNGIPLNSMQLDSWWYPKGDPPSWANSGDKIGNGQWLMRPDPAIIPDGLAGLQKLLGGVPLIVHARWIHPQSPLVQQYIMSGNVSTDPQYWSDLATYLKASGVMTYEQDWMASLAAPLMNLTDPEAYLDNMATAMASAGITMQYCGQSVAHFLQGSKYSNLTTARVSQDGFNRSRWDPFLYNSRLASALGIFPFADNVYSSDIKSLLLETHSAGMVGVADAIGQENPANIMQSIRPDGVIVKPDASMVPTDSTYFADAQAELQNGPLPPMQAFSYSDHNGLRTAYVFAYSRATDGSNATVTIAPGELGIQGPVYVYNYFAHTGRLVAALSTFVDSVDTNGNYYVVAPVGLSQIALLGDTGKFVTVGRQRVRQVADQGILTATLQFAAGEASTTIQGYSPTPPVVTAISGSVGQITYDPVAKLFTIPVAPGGGANHLAAVSISTN
ncbi:MAG TPA: hypothetical protein VKR43_12435 [Bryobacteraceae bacterium]|nr:hypothetical protein [Bryobacteraceae bacterium]